MSHLLIGLWGLAVFFAVLGFGEAVLRLCRYPRSPWAIQGSIGTVVFAFLCSLLNLVGAVRSWSLVSLVIGGAVLFLVLSIWHKRWPGREKFQRREGFLSVVRRDVLSSLLFACLVYLVGVPLFDSLHEKVFDYSDDLGAYLTFPVKTLATGSLPYEPFSERRVTSSLGAQYVLQSTMLVVGDVDTLSFIDRGMGLILLAGAIYALARSFGYAIRESLAACVVACLLPIDHTNLTMTTLPAALFATVFWLQCCSEDDSWGQAALMGALAGCVSSIKSSYLPAAALFCLVFYAIRWLRTRRGGVPGELLICAGSGLLTLVPWMLDMKRKERTFLYPILGKGYEIAAYGPVPHAAHAGAYPWLIASPQLALFCIAAMLLWLGCRRWVLSTGVEIAGILAVCGISILLISVSVGGASVTRYTTAFQLTGLTITLLLLLKTIRLEDEDRPYLIASTACAVVLVGALAFYGGTHSAYREYLHPEFEVSSPLDTLKDHQYAKALQASIPSGAAVFSALRLSYAFDFNRNPIYIADFPGMASLPPGLPTQGTPEDLRRYLLDHAIRYVAYSPSLIEDSYGEVQSSMRPGWTWPRMQRQVSEDVYRQIDALGSQYAVLYADPEQRLIDLTSPVSHTEVSGRMALLSKRRDLPAPQNLPGHRALLD